jgi:hypothetical protein
MVVSGSTRVTTTLIRPLCARNGQSHAKWPARRGGACSAATPAHVRVSRMVMMSRSCAT